jgi:hypothetical protein
VNSEPDRLQRVGVLRLRGPRSSTGGSPGDHRPNEEDWAEDAAFPKCVFRLRDLSVGGDRFTSWRTLEQVDREVD